MDVSDAAAWWRWNHALQQDIPAVPDDVLLMYACSFQHIVDDQITMLTNDPEWDRTYRAILKEVDRRSLHADFASLYQRFRGESAAAIQEIKTRWGAPSLN
jgi:hypothetical protein